MSKVFQPTRHPVLGLPSMEDAMAHGEAWWLETMARREAIIARELDDPYLHGWEPPMWRITDAIMGFPWVDAEFAAKLIAKLGLRRHIRAMLLNGGNRSGKSEYASKRVMRILRMRPRARSWCLHSKDQMSIDYQQPLLYKNLPVELRARDIRTRTTYVAYKQKTGFSEGKFVLPNGSDCTFLNYEMDRKSIEGGNLDIIWPDELVPPDWVSTMELRVAEKQGWILVTFTPVEGYTETVQMFQDGAEVLMEAVAFLVSKDGGAPDVARALGLTEQELVELREADEAKRAARFPQSRPQQCDLWLEGKTGQVEVPPGREFAKVPRVMKSVDPEEQRGVVFFHSADNPYGNPKSVWATIAGKNADYILERFYGVATKLYSARFPLFNEKVHVVALEDIPSAEAGTNYHYVDPCGGRNFFMVWVRVVGGFAYAYREWPSYYYIEDVGVPGAWAYPDGKRKDGRPGPAQETFGFGHAQYKREIGKLEGWADAEKPMPAEKSKTAAIVEWQEANGSRERIARRFMDSRYASAPKQERDRVVTLLTEFEDIGLLFEPTPGDDINEGVQHINNLLYYDKDKELNFFNQPRLKVSSECKNLIYALRTWTGADGQKGATKDPIDCLRYFVLSDCDDAKAEEYESEGGGHY